MKIINIVILVFISLLIITGFVYMQPEKSLEEKEIIEIAKQTEEVKAYLEEHPNAEVEATLAISSVKSEWTVRVYEDIYEFYPRVHIDPNGTVLGVYEEVAG
jgi:archaellum component FlaF (FlaF/FlaG flagellin family)